MSATTISNRTIKPFIELNDLYPGFKLEEECFSKAIVRDVDQKSCKKKKKSKQIGPYLENSTIRQPEIVCK